MKQLTVEQRYQIEAYLKIGMSKSGIAEAVRVDRSTIYRELLRNKKNGEGKPPKAHRNTRTKEKKGLSRIGALM